MAITTLSGLTVAYELVAAHTPEIEAAETVVGYLYGCDIFADKGFLGAYWQAEIRDRTGNLIWTAKKANQRQQNPRAFDQLLNRVRERIEGAFNELQNTGRNIERLLAKTVVGLGTRLIAKATNHLLKYLLRRDFGIDAQTFEVTAG